MSTGAGVVCCDVCREQFSPLLRYGLWIMAEIAIIGSDIQEVIGSAIALLLLSRGAIPLWGGVLLSVALSFTMLLVERCGIRKLEALFGVLISIMVASFAVRHSALQRMRCGWCGGLRLQALCEHPGWALEQHSASRVQQHSVSRVQQQSWCANAAGAQERTARACRFFSPVVWGLRLQRVPCGCCLVCR